jgi:hypothetical protein
VSLVGGLNQGNKILNESIEDNNRKEPTTRSIPISMSGDHEGIKGCK